LDRGWFVSFSGIITFKKSELLREVVKYVPLDRLFVETDTPYLAPQSKRGMQNEPAFVVETAAKVAELKGVSLEVVEKRTTQNISHFFSFK
jgi:TatD DNase family protein